MLLRITTIIKSARVAALGLLAAGMMAAPPLRAQQDAQLVIEAPELGRHFILDRAALGALPQTEFTTHTIWTEGPQRFCGVSLAVLLDHYRIEADQFDLVAVNDYLVTLGADDIGPVFPVIAHSRNGAPMSLRDKGPFWLVYDYDSNPDFQRETIYTRSVWQLERITAHSAPR
ncbi:hypothetical protein ABIE58_000317 [Roseovarius sp. MBR-78]|jgi:hypothetical protein|uniref:oxidoreductase n=1 Tax=Roseovarius sp. MBR-78 TaxID=3156460 RepID=UPI003394F40D